MRTVDLMGGGEILTEGECWDMLGREEFGRLAVVADGKPDIFPVNFFTDGHAILIHSNMGHKILASSGADVSFEVDNVDRATKRGWSVVVHGPATVEPADRPGSTWPGPKDFEIRIEPVAVTGRRITLPRASRPTP